MIRDSGNHENINPLEIYKILHQTLNYLETTQIKNVRLINSTWNYEAMQLLRQRDVILFYNLKQFSNFNHAFLLGESSPPLTKHFPYKSCIIGSDLLDTESPEFLGFHNEAIKFFQNFGRYFSEIHLNLGKSNSSLKTLLQRMLFKWFINLETLSILVKSPPFDFFDQSISEILPNIKNLYLNYIGYNEKASDMQPLLSFLLTKCTNLETISDRKPKFCKANRTSDYSWRAEPSNDSNLFISEQVLKCLSLETVSPFMENVSKVELTFCVTEEKLGHLIKYLNPNLNTVHLLLEDNLSGESLNRFLQTFRKNLEFLWIETNKSKLLNAFNWNRMDRLRKLWIIGGSLESFEFLKSCPYLEYLVVRNIKELPSFNSTFNERLKFCKFSNVKVSDEIGRELNLAFPTISTLHLDNVDNLGLKGILKHLPNLVGLCVSGKNISDEGLCGESDKVLRVLLESGVENSWKFCPSWPCISDLQNLQYFSIKSGQITDACLTLGLSKCMKLKRLEVWSTLELITNLGLLSLNSLQDLEYLRIFVRNSGWTFLQR